MLVDVLQIPQNIRCQQRTKCSGTEALCMLLKRFSYPCCYSDMMNRFGRPVPELSMITNTVMDYVFNVHGHKISQWNPDILSPENLQEYADVIHASFILLSCMQSIDLHVRHLYLYNI